MRISSFDTGTRDLQGGSTKGRTLRRNKAYRIAGIRDSILGSSQEKHPRFDVHEVRIVARASKRLNIIWKTMQERVVLAIHIRLRIRRFM